MMTTPDPSRTIWRKSSYSGASDSNCVEAARLGGAVAVRDSKDPDGPALLVTAVAWGAFLTAIPTR